MILKASFILLLLAGCVGGASVDIAFKHVWVGDDLTVNVYNISPSVADPKFDRLDCGCVYNGSYGVMILLAQYDKHAKVFMKPSVGLPVAFNDRIGYTGNYSFTIKKITPQDRKLILFCKLDYEDSGRTLHVTSNRNSIVAYDYPILVTPLSSNRSTVVKERETVEITCAVESNPLSRIEFLVLNGSGIRKNVSETSIINGTVARRKVWLYDLRPRHSRLEVACVANLSLSHSHSFSFYVTIIKVDGGWCSYNWFSCSKTCGSGDQSGHRQCACPPPSVSGKQCQGSANTNRRCNSQSCPTFPPNDSKSHAARKSALVYLITLLAVAVLCKVSLT